jgi:elongation factor G
MRTRTIASEIVPMLCGSAFKNKGVQRMLDAVIDYLPSPAGHPAGQGHRPTTRTRSRRARPTTTSRSRRWRSRSMTDPYVGQLTFVRVYSGVLEVRATRSTTRSRGKQGAHRPHRCRCTPTSARRSRKSLAGDIAACVGLKDVTTGDTLCDPDNADHRSSAWCSPSP